MPAPVASGWSGCRVGLAPTGKRRLFTAHTLSVIGEQPLSSFGLDTGDADHLAPLLSFVSNELGEIDR